MYLSSKGAQANSGEGVRLAKNTSEKVNLKEIKTVSDCIPISSNPDIVADMEDLASTWCKQIEQVNYVYQKERKTSVVSIFYIAETLPNNRRLDRNLVDHNITKNVKSASLTGKTGKYFKYLVIFLI